MQLGRHRVLITFGNINAPPIITRALPGKPSAKMVREVSAHRASHGRVVDGDERRRSHEGGGWQSRYVRRSAARRVRDFVLVCV
jgi:hypothetical protein